MKRLFSILLLTLLFSTAFTSGQTPLSPVANSDTLSSVWLYTEGIKKFMIDRDTTKARELFLRAIEKDSTYAPAYYQLATNNIYTSPKEAVMWAEHAWQQDTTNMWYGRSYGQALIMANQYAKAIDVFKRLCRMDDDPDSYRILAALYQQQNNPYMALSTLDSAEIRLGRIPLLSVMKRRLLVATHQFDKAITEAKKQVAETPFEIEHHIDLADLYGMAGKDSLALVEYDAAAKIDPTDINMLMSKSDFYNNRNDVVKVLEITEKLFASDKFPVKEKTDRFERYTSVMSFYQQYYPQIDNLARTLIIHHPMDEKAITLYARHLIATGELDRALELYKLHTLDTPPVKDFFLTIIDIESFKQRPDSVALYVNRALKHFPEETRLHLAKGNALGYSKKNKEAMQAYKESLKYADNDSLRSVVWGLIGDTYNRIAEESGEGKMAKKMMAKCYAAYDKGLNYDKNNILILNNYSYFLSLDGERLEHALDMSGRAIALDENNPTYIDTYAWILFKLGRLEEAKKNMQQALALDGRKSSELMVHYGDILAAMGQDFLAETYWRRALENGYDAEKIAERIMKLKEQNQ